MIVVSVPVSFCHAPLTTSYCPGFACKSKGHLFTALDCRLLCPSPCYCPVSSHCCPLSYTCLLALILIVVGIHFIYKYRVVRLEALSFCLNQISLQSIWFWLFIQIVPHAWTLFCFKIEMNACLVYWLPMHGLSKLCPHSRLSLILEIRSHGPFRLRCRSYISLHILRLTLKTWTESRPGCANVRLLANCQLPLLALRLSGTHLTWLMGHLTVP